MITFKWLAEKPNRKLRQHAHLFSSFRRVLARLRQQLEAQLCARGLEIGCLEALLLGLRARIFGVEMQVQSWLSDR
jgi:hypothetical protein